ncbi:extracellular solute-binding protein [Cellulosilyticum sp. I15G10I2]|uniref:extracellular solute-binding protein n=1 Tax=Cellulosilyticum sp. I15G10I2 TaxID=1892843 RepID=UPI00085CDC0F|nr:extracellular solute-binding protein [Cellulosilyticum sp. I15G10I2]
MRKIWSKLLTCAISGILALSSVGCGAKQEAPKEQTGKATETSSGNAAKETPSAEEKIKLSVWHLWTTDADANAKSFMKVFEQYKAEHPNVEIEIDASENEAYKTKIKTAMAANEGPDVFFSWGAGFAQPFVDAGQILPIEEYLTSEQKGNLLESQRSNLTYNDTLYGLPFVSWVGILYCNQEMFDQNGIKVPDTYEEYLEAIRAFNAKGIVPMSVGAKDGWPLMFYQNVLALRQAGADGSNAALEKKVPFNQPEFLNSAQLLSELVQAKTFDEASMAFTYDEAKMAFLSGEVPMFYIGSWFAGEVQDENISMVKDKVVAKNFPSIAGTKGNKDEFLGGAIDCFMVNNNTKHKKEAAEFAAYMAEHMAKESFILGAGLPAWKIDTQGETIDPLVQQMVDLANKATGFVLAWDTKLSGEAAEKHKTLVQEVFAGTKTPQQFVDEMDALK